MFRLKALFILPIFAPLILFCNQQVVSVKQKDLTKKTKKVIAFDLVRTIKNDTCSHKSFNSQKLDFHWKKNPGRFNNLSFENQWINTQMTFSENKKIYSNISKDSLFFFDESECNFEILKGNYEFSFSLGLLKNNKFLQEKDSIFEVYLDNQLIFNYDANNKKTETWENYIIKLNVLKKKGLLKLKWSSNNNNYLFVGSPLIYEKKQTNKKNVILLVIDAFRTDTLDFYESKFSITPNLSELSKNSIIFKNSFSNANWTKPSMFSFFYSDYASNIGVSNTWFYHKDIDRQIFYSNKNKNLIFYFRDNQYLTKSIMNNVFLLDYTTVGYDLGFHDLYQVGKDHIDTIKIIENAQDFVRKNKDKPFFLHLNLNTPHWPYNSEDKYKNLIKKQNPKEWKKLDYYYKKYLSEIYYTDKKIGEFFETLKKENLFDDSWIVFVSDHGEIFGGYHDYHHHFVVKNGYGHGETHYDQELKIPWIIKYPLSLKEKIKKKFFENQVSLISLMPTLLGLNHIDYNKSVVKGNDYSKPIYEERGKDFEEVVYSEGRMSESIRTSDFKYIRRYPGYDLVSFTYRGKKHQMGEELYNLKTDPEEKKNIIFNKGSLNTARLILSEYSLSKNSFYIKIPKRDDNLPWNIDLDIKGNIYKISTYGEDLDYQIFSPSKLKIISYNNSLLEIKTVDPVIDYSLKLIGNKKKNYYRIGKLGLKSNYKNIASNKNLVVAEKDFPLNLSNYEVPFIYNNVNFYNTVQQKGKKIVFKEIKNILKNWGYIYQ